MNEDTLEATQRGDKKHLSPTQRMIVMLWIAFLMAGLATVVFFAAIDPEALRACVSFPEMSRTGAYTTGFLLFWILTTATSVLTCYLLKPMKH